MVSSSKLGQDERSCLMVPSSILVYTRDSEVLTSPTAYYATPKDARIPLTTTRTWVNEDVRQCPPINPPSAPRLANGTRIPNIFEDRTAPSASANRRCSTRVPDRAHFGLQV